MNPIRIMIVDDHPVMRFGLRSMIEAEPDFEVVAEASCSKDAISIAPIRKPDIVMMDVRMPDGGGVETCREIKDRNPAIQVIMLTAHSDDEALFASILAGAAGYLLKDMAGKDLVESIRKVSEGKALLDPGVTKQVLERVRAAKIDEKDPLLAALSPHQERILDLIAEGLTNREIASQVNLSEKTVKNYVSTVLHKLHVARRSEAASYVARAKAQRNKPLNN